MIPLVGLMCSSYCESRCRNKGGQWTGSRCRFTYYLSNICFRVRLNKDGTGFELDNPPYVPRIVNHLIESTSSALLTTPVVTMVRVASLLTATTTPAPTLTELKSV